VKKDDGSLASSECGCAAWTVFDPGRTHRYDEIRAEVAKGNLSLERKRTLVLATKLPNHRECANRF